MVLYWLLFFFLTKMSKSRNWTGTLNNFTPVEREAMMAVNSSYKVIGTEHMGPGEGTPHLQMYFHFENPQRLAAMKKINARAHWETMYSTPEAASNYCKKEPGFYEHGVLPMAPKAKGEMEKERWAGLLKEAREKGEVDDPKVQFLHGKLVDYHYDRARRQRTYETMSHETRHEWWWGETGTGKSKKWHDLYPKAFRKTRDGYWGDYDDQEVVVIEEMGPQNAAMVEDLKEWADIYPFQANVKHVNSRTVRPKLIIVCSNYHPRSIWEKKEDLEPILRRFKVTEFVKLRA